MLQQALIALFQYGHLGEDVFQALLNIGQVLFRVDRQRLCQVISETDVIHDKAAMLVPGYTVNARDSLQQVVLLQPLVDIHDLLDRCIEAREQHVTHDEKGDAGKRFVRIVKIERPAEILYCVPRLGFLA